MLVSVGRTKSLMAEQTEHVRGLAQKIVAEDFDGNVSRAAKALGISQSTLQILLAQKRGAGQVVLNAIANYRQMTIDSVLGRGTSSMTSEATVIPGALSQTIEAHPEWPAAVKSSLRAMSDRTFRPEVWQRLGARGGQRGAGTRGRARRAPPS